MILKSINYEIETTLVRCTIQHSPAENIFVQFEYVLQDNELEQVSLDWWVSEVKQLLSLKLQAEVL